MMKKIRLAIVCIIITINIIYIKQNTTYANQNTIYKTYYLKDTYKEELSYNEHILLINMGLEQKIKLILDTYFYNNKKNIRYIPKDSKVINIDIMKNDLYVNFNKEILGYGGGNYYEINLIRQILHTLFQFKKIKTVTFLVEGELIPFPEGRIIVKYKRSELKILDDNQNIHIN